MEKKIVEGQLGKEAVYKVEFKEGKLCAEVLYDSPMFDAGVVLKLDAETVLEALKKAIPGAIDDVVIDSAKKLIKAV
jgi:hypothetical protein